MKKIILLSLTVVSVGQTIQAQQGTTNIVPPSPQADEMIRYGNQPLNEYKGMAQINIPIAEIKEKDLSNSINLVYASLGVKVNDISNNVGVSWLLNAGGVITRTINDLPDEMQLPSDRLIFNNLSELNGLLSITDNSSNSTLLKSYFTNESYDNQIDIFSLSVNGLTGRFYLDKNLNPILLTQNNQFKIQTVGDFKITHQFILTTNEGIKYYFGGDGATEKTWKRETPAYSGITSFYLTKITNPAGNELNFGYINLGAKALLFPKYETKFIEGKSISEYKCTNENSQAPGAINADNILRINGAKQLASITSTDKKIIFNYSNPDNTLNEKLFSIEILNSANKKIKKVEFEYLNQYSALNSSVLERFYLTKMKFYNYQGDNLLYDNEYAFSYDDPTGLPDRNSYNVDVFGYFNNKTNLSYIPDLDLLNNTKNFPSNFNKGTLADRTSNFEFAKKGTLISIKYPTKGETKFEYEAIPQNVPTSEYIGGEVINSPHTAPIQEYTSELDGSRVADNKVDINLSIRQFEILSLTTMLEVNFKIMDKISGDILFDESVFLPKTTQEDIDNGYRMKDADFQFLTDPAKKYILKLSLKIKPNVNYNGTFSLGYRTHGYNRAYISGLRLKKTYDVGMNNDISNIKRIYYSAFKDIDNNAILPSNLYYENYKIISYFATSCTSSLPLQNEYYYKTYNNTSIASEPLNYFKDNEIVQPFTYPITTISYGGDHFEKGGEEKVFVNNTSDIVSIFKQPDSQYYLGDTVDFSQLTNNFFQRYRTAFFYEDFNGKMLTNRIITNKNDQLFVDKKTEYNYDFQPISQVYDLSGTEAFSLLTSFPEKIVSNLYIYSMTKNIYSIFLKNSKSTQYFDNVPLSAQNDTAYKKLITTTEYSYTNPSHYQLTSEKTVFPDQSTTEVTYRYAHEKGNQRLINANMIGIPLETETIQTIGAASKRLSKTETKYDNPLNLLPSSVLSVDLQNTLSTEVTYDQYDSKGNLQQYTTKAGIPVSIIWGYNKTQPIAKIEGASYTQLENLISAIVTASNTDADAGMNNDETVLLNTLKTFRDNLPGYQITTYTYDPLIGVRTITPPSGIRENYLYNISGRLEKVTDMDGKILKEVKYNYKN